MPVNKEYKQKTLDNKNYTITPNALYKLKISSNAKTLFGYLASCGEDFNPNQRSIAKHLNIARDTVRKAIEELVAANMIAINTNHKKDIYILNEESDWITNLSVNKVNKVNKPCEFDFDYALSR